MTSFIQTTNPAGLVNVDKIISVEIQPEPRVIYNRGGEAKAASISIGCLKALMRLVLHDQPDVEANRE